MAVSEATISAGVPGPQGVPGQQKQLTLQGAAAVAGRAYVYNNGKASVGSSGVLASYQQHAGILLTSASAGTVTVIDHGPVDPAIVNLGAGVACAVGTDANGNPVRVTDAACVSGLKYLGVCEANGAIYVAPRRERFFDITDFGAVADADGTHGTGTDNTISIQKAFDAAGAVGGEVFIPIGKYRVTAPLTQSHFTKIRGAGAKSVIVCDHSGDGLMHAGLVNGSTNGSGVLDYFALQSTTQVIGAASAMTNASPIVVTLTGHGLSTGDFVNITNALGNTAANGPWQITRIDADTFSLNNSTGNGTYTASSGTVSRAGRIGIYELACSFDTHRNIQTSGFFFGRAWDQSELCSSYDYIGAGNLITQDWLISGDDINVGDVGGFTNNLVFVNSQYNGGLYGLVDDGGEGHVWISTNFNGNTTWAALLSSVQQGVFLGGDCESNAVRFTYQSLLKANSVGQCNRIEFSKFNFDNGPSSCFSIGSLGSLTLRDCDLADTGSYRIVGGSNAGYIATDNITYSGTLYDGPPTTGNVEATGGPFGVKVLRGAAAPTTGTWRQGDIVWSTSVAAGGNIGWVCTTGGTPGTWKTFGAIAS